jgi:hypothetical protein
MFKSYSSKKEETQQKETENGMRRIITTQFKDTIIPCCHFP